MAIDTHIHLTVSPEGKAAYDHENLFAQMDRNNVTGALIMPLMGLFSNCKDYRADNDGIAEFCKKMPERLFPCFTVNPLSPEQAVEEVKRCKNDLGISVMKLHPWLQGFSVTYEQMDAVARVCQELGVTIIFHDGTPPYCTPLQIARLAREYPDLKVVSGHAGLNDLWPNAVLAAKRYPNFYLCLCGVTTGQMRQIIDQVPPEQICIGSDLILGLKLDFCDDEDALWYRWQVWRKINVSQKVSDIIENQTPRRLLNLQ